jgi:hypothetical protein
VAADAPAVPDPGLRLATALTLVAFLLQPPGPPQIRIPAQALAALGLLWPRALFSPGLWALLAALAAARVALDWPLADNHAYLGGLWCLAIALALLGTRPGEQLALSARALVALVFGFAVLWKGVLSPDYLDGTFFRVTLLLDPRFEPAARWLGGLDPERLAGNREALLSALRSGGSAAPALVEPARFAWAVAGSTWWTLLVEVALALAFSLPRVPGRLRHGLLVLFCATTFAIAPVAGFGWLLVAMGLAQTAPGVAGWRIAYLAAALLILLFRGLARTG